MGVCFCAYLGEMIAGAQSDACSHGLQNPADDGREENGPDETIAQEVTCLEVDLEVAWIYCSYGYKTREADESEETLP